MKQIVEIYGKFLLDAVLALMILTLLLGGITDEEGNRGIFAMIGARLNVTTVEDTGCEEFAVYQSEAQRNPPVISYRNPGMIYTGTHVFSDYIKAEDAGGTELSVRLLEVEEPDGSGRLVEVPRDTREVEFTRPGIYRLKVTAKDDRNKRTISVIQIPVNRRRNSHRIVNAAGCSDMDECEKNV